MDATTTRFTSKTALFIAIGLIAAPGIAQAQLQVSTNSVTLGAQAQVTVSSGSGAINFNATPNYGTYNNSSNPAPSGWFTFCVNATATSCPSSGSTPLNGQPATLFITLARNDPFGIGYTGSITLTNTASASDTQVITIKYTPSSGTTGGGITVTPTNVSLPTASPGQTSLTQTSVSISTTSASTVSGTISVSTANGISWLSASQSTFSVVSGAATSFSVFGNAQFLAAGSYQGTITITPTGGNSVQIPVTFNVGTASGAITASPNSVTLSYPNGPTSASVVVTDPNCPSCTYAAASNASWLLVNGLANFTGQFIGTFGSTFTVSLTTNTSLIPTASSSATITLVASDNSQTTVSVFLNVGTSTGITLSPNPLSFSLPNGGSQSQNLTITSPTSGITFSVTPNQSWLSVSSYPTGTTLNAGSNNFVTITANPAAAGLGTGTYSGSLTFFFSNGASQSVGVTLVVGSSSGGGAGGIVAPSSLTFSHQLGNTAFENLQANVLVNSTVNSVSTSANWLQAFQFGNQVQITVSPGGLAAGSQSGTVTINTAAGIATVQVTLTITSSMVISANPSAIIVSNWNAGDPLPQPVLQVTSSDGSFSPVTATSNASWITVTQANQTTPATLGLKIDPTGLPNGLNSSSITVTAGGAQNSPLTVPVAIIVNGNSGTGGIVQPSVTNLPINAAVNGSPVTIPLGVTASSATTYTAVVSTSTGGNWLSVSPTTATGSMNLQVTGNPAGLAAGTYTGNIALQVNGFTQSNVTVTMNVGTGAGTVVVTASPTTLTFTSPIGATSAPASQAIQVTSVPSGSAVTASATTQTGGNWLSVATAAGSSSVTPMTLTVTANPGNLAAGTYTGTVTITPSNGGTAASVQVTLNVVATAVSATPTNLSFSFQAGGSTPAAQTVQVSGAGGQALPFTATASSNGNWLSVSPASGNTPSTLQVSVNPSGLAAGNYNGTITVQGTGTATGTTTISVTLNVTAPLPTITKISNSASYATGVISPGELIAIFGTSLGPQTPVQTQLDANGRVATTLGNVQVLVNGIPAPLVYVSSTQVTAVVPYEIKQFQTATVLLRFLGQSSNGVAVQVVTTNPGIYTANASGTGPAAALNENFTQNSPSNPAVARGTTNGTVVTLYLTGEGETSPNGVTGLVTQARTTAPFTPAPLLPVGVTLDGAPIGFDFAGEAPTLVSGVMQLNIRIPPTARAGELPVIVTIGPNQSQVGVTVSVR